MAITSTSRRLPADNALGFRSFKWADGHKEGWAEGECSTCTVVMVVDEHGRSAYRMFNSCLMFLPMAANREFYTSNRLRSTAISPSSAGDG